MSAETVRYRMNPAEDKIMTGDELKAGMLVLNENAGVRQPRGDSEDERLRAECFRRIVRLIAAASPDDVRFVGEWPDGYQEVHTCQRVNAWLVKKTPAELSEADPEMPA